MPLPKPEVGVAVGWGGRRVRPTTPAEFTSQRGTAPLSRTHAVSGSVPASVEERETEWWRCVQQGVL